MKKIILLSALIFMYLNVHAQYSLKGTIKDIQNNLPIPSAIVSIPKTDISTTSNNDGIFELKSNNEITLISIKAIGYETKEMKITELNLLSMSRKLSMMIINYSDAITD